MEGKHIRRLIDKNKRMVGIGDVSHAAPAKLTADVTTAVSAHHG